MTAVVALSAHRARPLVSLTALQDQDDATLASAAAAGEMRAFELLFSRHAGRAYALCLRMSGDRQRARELAHDAFVRAWERIGTFRGEAAFGTWLHRLTVNVVLESTRAERRRSARVALVGDESEAPEDFADPIAPDVGSRIDLERGIALLPPNARQVFVLHDVEGYRHDEIARQMSIAPGTVRAHLHRARKFLLTWLNR